MGATFRWRIGPAPSKRKTIRSESLKDPRSTNNDPTAEAANRHRSAKADLLERKSPRRATLPEDYNASETGRDSAPAVQRTSHATILSAHNRINHGNSDPFGATAIPLTAFHIHLLSLWQPFFFDVVWPTPARAGQEIDRQPATLAWTRQLSLVIRDEAAMSALLAVGSILRAGDSTDPSQKASLLNQGLKHMNAAVKILQRSLAPARGEALSHNTKNDGTIYAAYYLACLDAFTGHMESARTHLKGLRSMAKEQGGFKKLTWPLKCQAIPLDLFVAQSSLEEIIFEVAEYDPGSFWKSMTPQERRALVQYYRLRERKLDSLSTPNTQHIFRRYCELLAVHNLAGKMKDRTRNTKMLLWAHMRKYALAAQVLDVRLRWTASYAGSLQAEDSSPLAAQASLDLCACIAMRYAEQIVFNATSGIVSVYADYAELKRILSRPDICQYANAGLLLWILSVASIIEEIVSTARDLLKSRWHLLRFFGLSQVLGLTTVESIVEVMNQYLYDDASMGKHMQLLLDKGSRLFKETRPGIDPQGGSGKAQDSLIDHSSVTPAKNEHLTRLLTITLPDLDD